MARPRQYAGGAKEPLGATSPGAQEIVSNRVRILWKYQGGNHAGFGDYGIQAYDGERTISLEDQQSQTARHLVAFLKSVRKRG